MQVATLEVVMHPFAGETLPEGISGPYGKLYFAPYPGNQSVDGILPDRAKRLFRFYPDHGIRKDLLLALRSSAGPGLNRET